MAEQRTSQHGEWSSRWAFILAATGAAVGLGNIWKFPYIAGENGGGAFVLVYLFCVAIIGIPIMMAEIMMGRMGRQNPADSIRSLAHDSGVGSYWSIVGYTTIAAGYLILTYYSVIAGWAVDYVVLACTGHFQNASPAYIARLFSDLTANPMRMLFWHSLVTLATTAVVAYGIEKGIERSVRYLFPSMVLLLLLIAGYSMTTGYFGHGWNFLFHPNFHALSAKAVLIALGHAFFTLSLATGTIMMYGAYLPRDASIPKATLYIAISDTAIALIAGLAIFPIVFANGLEPQAGPGLIFKTLPIAFGRMPAGFIIAPVFFIMLVFAAFTSAISLLEPATAWLIERFRLSRRAAACLAGLGVWILGIGTVLSFNVWRDVKLFGLDFFELMDYLTANLMLPLGGLFIALFAAWRLQKQAAINELNFRNGWYYKSWRIVLGVIAPIGIGIVFLSVVGII